MNFDDLEIIEHQAIAFVTEEIPNKKSVGYMNMLGVKAIVMIIDDDKHKRSYINATRLVADLKATHPEWEIKREIRNW